MNEFVVKLADERGRVQEQTHAAATAEELRARFTQAGYYVYSVKARGVLGTAGKKKVKLETFLIFNQQFLTLIRAGLPILGSLELLGRRQKIAHFRGQLEDVAARVKTGESISQAFEAQGGFPLVYTTTLLAGERSGNLEEVLQRFLDFQRVSLTFRLDLSGAAHRVRDCALHLFDYVCGAAVCEALRPAGNEAAGADHFPVRSGTVCAALRDLLRHPGSSDYLFDLPLGEDRCGGKHDRSDPD
jgi:hypothetical protein